MEKNLMNWSLRLTPCVTTVIYLYSRIIWERERERKAAEEGKDFLSLILFRSIHIYLVNNDGEKNE